MKERTMMKKNTHAPIIMRDKNLEFIFITDDKNVLESSFSK
jgi:hypothetical protein